MAKIAANGTGKLPIQTMGAFLKKKGCSFHGAPATMRVKYCSGHHCNKKVVVSMARPDIIL
jgi:hypothetical protein